MEGTEQETVGRYRRRGRRIQPAAMVAPALASAAATTTAATAPVCTAIPAAAAAVSIHSSNRGSNSMEKLGVVLANSSGHQSRTAPAASLVVVEAISAGKKCPLTNCS